MTLDQPQALTLDQPQSGDPKSEKQNNQWLPLYDTEIKNLSSCNIIITILGNIFKNACTKYIKISDVTIGAIQVLIQLHCSSEKQALEFY